MNTSRFPAQFNSLDKISEVVHQAAQMAGLDENAIYEVQLAVNEACSNIIRHAYKGSGRGEIYLTPNITPDSLTITLRDHGAPFEPERVPIPALSQPIDEMELQGLGLYWMRKLVDEVRFEFTPDEGNILTLVKRKKGLS